MSPGRYFVMGHCAADGTGFVLQMSLGQPQPDRLYCSAGCRRRAHRHRRAEMRCITAGCGLSQRGSLVCGRCYLAMSGMCRGKRPLDEPTARRQATPDRDAYDCTVCGCWHTGRRMPAADSAAVRDIAARAVTAIRRVHGPGRLDELVAGWSPAVMGRQEWSQRLAAR